MVLLSLSFDSLHGILRRLYDEMTELCQPMMTLATAIAAQVGTGNIVGASGAILIGGPGAIASGCG